MIIGIMLIVLCVCSSCSDEITDPINITIVNKLSNKDTLIISGIDSWSDEEVEPGRYLDAKIQRGTRVTATGKADKKFIISHIFSDDNEVWTIKD